MSASRWRLDGQVALITGASWGIGLACARELGALGARLLLVADTGEGRLSMRVLDTRATPWRELARQDDVGEARFDARSNAVWFVRTGVPGLWRSGPMLDAPVQVTREQPWVYWMRLWMVARGKPYSVQPAGEDCVMGLRELAPGAQARCLEEKVSYAFGEPTLTADAGWMYFSAATRSESIDIGTVKLD